MSQRLGMADGRCFTIQSSAQLFQQLRDEAKQYYVRGQLLVP